MAEAPEAAGVLLFAISVNLDRDFEPAPPAMALFDEVFACDEFTSVETA